MPTPYRHIVLRDSILFFLLIAVVQTIIQRNSTTYKRQLYNLYAVHEVDPAFLQQAQQGERQIKTLLSLLAPDEYEHKKQLHTLEKDIVHIRNAYEKNSPALVFLGPIGSASIVLKEQRLEKKLLKTLTTTNKFVAQLAHKRNRPCTKPSASTIETALNNNEHILTLLRQT